MNIIFSKNHTYRTGFDIWDPGYVAWQIVPASYRYTEVLWIGWVRPGSTVAFGVF